MSNCAEFWSEEMNEPEVDSVADLPLSKTKKKQMAKEIEALAIRLVELPLAQFKKLKLDEDIASEVKEARDTLGRGSHKRQVKHLAGALRVRDDRLPMIFAALEDIDQVKRMDKRQFHRLEDLRDRLCDQERFQSAFDEMVSLWPALDHAGIARLAQSVHNFGDKRASREIFKRLRDYSEQTSDK
ncbi:ribosome biogenesis factor YjgA [Geopsychrobacter electrodiphilus]|uniref:ribosome biogenesis factor YjgA n=1 Tax=Geopsychrobacter electrodiphilus TaxID=225196 RepID=UPI000368DE8A|nr:ribosome biogenesis factor YjgA [Geopsychrobacter electrodiphilus]